MTAVPEWWPDEWPADELLTGLWEFARLLRKAGRQPSGELLDVIAQAEARRVVWDCRCDFEARSLGWRCSRRKPAGEARFVGFLDAWRCCAPLHGSDTATMTRIYSEQADVSLEIGVQDLGGMDAAQLRGVVDRLDARLNDLHVADGGELRTFTGDEQSEFDDLMRLRDRAGQHLKIREQFNRYPGSVQQVYRGHGGGDSWATAPGADPRLQQYRSAAMGTIDRNVRCGVLGSAAADRLDRVLREGDGQAYTARYLSAVGNEHYRSAFAKLLRDPMQGHLRFGPEEVDAMRETSWAQQQSEMRAAITTQVTGFPLPISWDPSIILTGAGALNPVRDISSVQTIGTHDWQGVSSDGVTAGYVQEGVEATDATPALVGPKISTQQGRAFVQYTIEAAQDDPTLQQQLVQLIADAKNVVDATKFLSGTGTNEPSGILNIGGTNGLTTTQRVLTATTAAFAVGDPWLLKAALPARFVNSATFAAAPGTFDTTFRFVGGNSTEPYQFADGGRSGDFLGRPKVEWSTMATGAATGTKLIIGGDFRTGYKIVDRLGLSAELLPHMLGTNRLPLGVRGLYVYWRTGAGVIAVNAFRYLEVK